MKDKIIEIIENSVSPERAEVKAKLIIILYNQYVIDRAKEYLREHEVEKSNAVASLIINVL